MNKLTPFKADRDEAIIIAQGPSRDKIFENPEFASQRCVCVVNRAGIDWPHAIDYWVTYHFNLLPQWWAGRELVGKPMPKMAICSAWKGKTFDYIPHHNVSMQVQGLNGGGTSSILAAMVLLDMGYKAIHLFGVDLSKEYSKDRKFWKILKDEPLIFHGEEWFHDRLFDSVGGW